MSELKKSYGFEEKKIKGKKVKGIFHPKIGYCYTDTKSPLFVPKEGIKYCDFREMEFEHAGDEEENFKDVVCKSYKSVKDLSVFLRP